MAIKAFKDGRVWSARDDEYNICISGKTRVEAERKVEQARTVLGMLDANPHLRESLSREGKSVKV